MGDITLFPGGGFKKEAFDSFGDRSYGTVEVVIKYGHPEDSLSRQWSKRVRLELVKRKGDDGTLVVHNLWSIKEESDLAI